VHEAVSSSSITDFFADHWRSLIGSACAWAITLTVPLYATLQVLPMSTRSGFSYEMALEDSMHPLTLVTLFVRNFFNNANLSTYWGPGDISETFLYAGILPVVLLLVLRCGDRSRFRASVPLLLRRWSLRPIVRVGKVHAVLLVGLP